MGGGAGYGGGGGWGLPSNGISGYGGGGGQFGGPPMQGSPIGSRQWRQEHPVMGASGWLAAHPNYAGGQPQGQQPGWWNGGGGGGFYGGYNGPGGGGGGGWWTGGAPLKGGGYNGPGNEIYPTGMKQPPGPLGPYTPGNTQNNPNWNQLPPQQYLPPVAPAYDQMFGGYGGPGGGGGGWPFNIKLF